MDTVKDGKLKGVSDALPPPSSSPSQQASQQASRIRDARRHDPRWQQRRDRFIALRAVSVPTAIVRRFFQIEGIRKAMLMAFNLYISILPLMIIMFAFVSRVRRRISLSQVFIEQFHLKGETAQVVLGAFPRTDNIIKVASVIAIGSFALSGFDVASVFQKTFAESWNVKQLKGWRGPVRGGIWFVAVFATFALGQVLQRIPSRHGPLGYLVTMPIVLTMNYWFWLITPRLLLDKQLNSRDLRPGAILGMVGSTALWVLSLVILPGWFDWYGRGFGGVGYNSLFK